MILLIPTRTHVGRTGEDVGFISHFRYVPVIKDGGIYVVVVIEHTGHISDAAGVPVGERGKVGEGSAVVEHTGHISDGGGIPVSKRGEVSEGGAVTEHRVHISDATGVPV